MHLERDGHPVPIRTFRFPGGEIQVRIEDDAPAPPAPRLRIHARLRSSDDLMALLLLTDAARRRYNPAAIDLLCPYLPYARQDRVAFPGEALSAQVLCRLLNTHNYNTVEVWDAHSDVSLALLDRVTNRPASDFAAPLATPDTVVVAPDAGARKRAAAVARLAGARLVTATKTRSTDTGEITGTAVDCDHLGNRPVLIVDDICDGGRTFTELARVLRPLTTGPVSLFVTHGIFSAGFDALHPALDRIHTANPFPDTLPDFVQVVGN